MAQYPIKLAGGLSVANKYGPSNDVYDGKQSPAGIGAGIIQSSFAFGVGGAGTAGFANQAYVVFQWADPEEGLQFSLYEGDDKDSADPDDWTLIPGKESAVYTTDTNKLVCISLEASELTKKSYAWRMTITGDTHRSVSILHFTGAHRYGPGKDSDNPNVIEIIM